MVKIENKFLKLFVLLVVLLISGRYISDVFNPIVLTENSFKCVDNQCKFSFILENISSNLVSGKVHVHFRDNLGVGSYKSTASILPSVQIPFDLGANESITISDTYKTSRENVEIYYAVSKTEI